MTHYHASGIEKVEQCSKTIHYGSCISGFPILPETEICDFCKTGRRFKETAYGLIVCYSCLEVARNATAGT